MGNSNAKEDPDLGRMVTLSRSDPGSVIDDVDRVLPYLTEESYQERKRASEIVLNLSKNNPAKLSEYFDALSRYIREVDSAIQLDLVRACNEMRGYISDGSLRTHREVFLSLLVDKDSSEELLESAAGVISDIARVDPTAAAPHVDRIALLLYSDVPGVAVNALRALESIAKHDASVVSPYTDELFKTIEYSAIPEENRLALSILGYVAVSNPTEIDDRKFVSVARELALSEHEIVTSEAVKEIGLVIADRPEMADDLLDIVVRNMNSSFEQTRRQAMIECLRIANFEPQLFGEVENIDPSYVSRIVSQLIDECNYESQVPEALELANEIGG